MCKLFMMTEMSKIKLNDKFINLVNNAVTAAGDDHAFGYSILSKDGYLGGERTEKPDMFRALGPSPENLKAGKLSRVLIDHNRFGRIETNKAKSMIAHGRFSTNERLLRSVHPFVSDDTTLALAHNGVVRDTVYRDSPVEALLKTKCDTEILLRYWELGGLDAITENVGGYYALGVLDSMDGTLHVVKDSKASLVISWSETADSYLIATTAEIIKFIASNMKWKIDPCLSIQDNSYMVFRGNDVIQSSEIKPKADYTGYNYNTSGAFGHDKDRKTEKWESYKYNPKADTTDEKPDTVETEKKNTEITVIGPTVTESRLSVVQEIKELVNKTNTDVTVEQTEKEVADLPVLNADEYEDSEDTEQHYIEPTLAELFAQDEAAYNRALRSMTAGDFDLDDNPRFNRTDDAEPYYRRKEENNPNITRYTGHNGEQIEYDRSTGKTKYYGGWD